MWIIMEMNHIMTSWNIVGIGILRSNIKSIVMAIKRIKRKDVWIQDSATMIFFLKKSWQGRHCVCSLCHTWHRSFVLYAHVGPLTPASSIWKHQTTPVLFPNDRIGFDTMPHNQVPPGFETPCWFWVCARISDHLSNRSSHKSIQ